MRKDTGWSHVARGPFAIAVAIALLVTLALATTAGATQNEAAAYTARAKAEAALIAAQSLGVPAANLAALRDRISQIDAQRGWFGISNTQAAAQYLTVIPAAKQTTDDTASGDRLAARGALDALAEALRRAAATGAVPVSLQEQRQAEERLYASLTTPAEFASLLDATRATLTAAHALPSAQTLLSQLTGTMTALRAAGLADPFSIALLSQARDLFATAATAGDLALVGDTAAGALMTLASDQTQAIPYVGAALLRSWGARIDLARGLGVDVTSATGALRQAQTELTTVATPAQFIAFQQRVTAQSAGLDLSLARGQASHDIDQLQSLIDYGAAHNIMEYEYASGDVGIGQSRQDFANAVTVQDFQAVDDETVILLTNLRAMISNLADPTPYNQPHATDLQLLQTYHDMTGKVIIVSFREQALRAYQDGKLVMAILITSGRPELPSPPGVTSVSERLSPTVFTSGEPVGSPFWYGPTKINYALLYHDGGYFIHDAWWRLMFGPGSNLPHNDPLAFNGGSHGCVNVPLQQMADLYAWTPLNTPVILY